MYCGTKTNLWCSCLSLNSLWSIKQISFLLNVYTQLLRENVCKSAFIYYTSSKNIQKTLFFFPIFFPLCLPLNLYRNWSFSYWDFLINVYIYFFFCNSDLHLSRNCKKYNKIIQNYCLNNWGIFSCHILLTILIGKPVMYWTDSDTDSASIVNSSFERACIWG